MRQRATILRAAVRAVILLRLLAPGFTRADDSEDIAFFESRIRPVLAASCYECHSSRSDSIKGGLRLDTREGIRKGGDIGPAVVPGQPEESLLLDALRYDLVQMPPSGKLPDRVIADFEAWIARGAPDPREDTSAADDPAPRIDFATARESWAYQTPRRQDPPKVSRPGWVRRPIDAFLLARLEDAGIEPNAEADRRTLIRRLTFDLTGLPPTPAEVEAFVRDSSPEAYERLVERRLASPGYGERWVRLWLDLMRYAEDQAHIVGDDTSLCYPNAYLYRDWVIAALNADMPYDRFVRLQLAADLIEPDDDANHAALGFLGLGPKYYRRNALDVMADEWEDRVDVVSRGLLGLTVACARCHDHKFDPISTQDYYALAGIFASTEMFNRPLDESAKAKENGQAEKPEEALHIVRDAKTIADLNVFIRGNVDQKGPVVARRFLAVLDQDGEPEPFATEGSGRRELAEAITDPSNPLTARVLVNRVWAQVFGRPLVGTPSNFGSLGEPPTHPELLDDLAARFVENGWSLKWLLSEMVLSSAYRQSSQVDPETWSADPENRLIGRMNRKRLPIEAWRDAILSASGRLDGSIGGPSIEPQDPDVMRRTVYSRVSRLELNRMLALFDFPDPNTHSERRVRTTTPLQKLFVLNSLFLVSQASALADRLAREAGGDHPEARIRRAYALLYGREPAEDEIQLGLDYLDQGEEPDWAGYTQALLAANELLFID